MIVSVGPPIGGGGGVGGGGVGGGGVGGGGVGGVGGVGGCGGATTTVKLVVADAGNSVTPADTEYVPAVRGAMNVSVQVPDTSDSVKALI